MPFTNGFFSCWLKIDIKHHELLQKYIFSEGSIDNKDYINSLIQLQSHLWFADVNIGNWIAFIFWKTALKLPVFLQCMQGCQQHY